MRNASFPLPTGIFGAFINFAYILRKAAFVYKNDQLFLLQQPLTEDGVAAITGRSRCAGVAEIRLARRPKDAPEPTALQLDFIKASEAEDTRQQSAEAQRLREMLAHVARLDGSTSTSLAIKLGLVA